MVGPEKRKQAQRLAEFRLRLEGLSAEEIERLLDEGRIRSPERIAVAEEVLAALRAGAPPQPGEPEANLSKAAAEEPAESVAALEEAAAEEPAETEAAAEASPAPAAEREPEMPPETPPKPAEEAIIAAGAPAAALSRATAVERVARVLGTLLTVALVVAIGAWLVKR